MRLKETLFLLALVSCSCQRAVDSEFDALTFYASKTIRTHPLGLNYYHEGYLQARLNEQDYLIGVNLTRSSLDFFNTKDHVFEFSINIPQEGRDGISTNNLVGIYAYNDEISIITPYAFTLTTISQSNKSIAIQQKIDLTGTGYRFNATTFDIQIEPEVPLVAASAEFYLIPFYPQGFGNPKEFVEADNLYILEKNRDSIQSIKIDWPIELIVDKDNLLHPLRMKYFPLVVDHHLFISFPFTSQIYKYKELASSDYVVFGHEQNFDDLIPAQQYKSGEAFSQKVIFDFIYGASFLPLMHNKVKNILFRIMVMPQNIENQDRRLWIRERDKLLLEYSLDGKLLTKTIIPPHLDMVPLVMVDGSYWFPKWKDLEEEDFIVFEVYK